jgi:hypothetical protein
MIRFGSESFSVIDILLTSDPDQWHKVCVGLERTKQLFGSGEKKLHKRFWYFVGPFYFRFLSLLQKLLAKL